MSPIDPSRRTVATVPVFLLAAILGSILFPGAEYAAEESPGYSIPLTEWLLLGPAPAPLPVFHGETPGSFSLEDLLSAEQIRRPGMTPAEGEGLAWSPAVRLEWNHINSGETGMVSLDGDGGEAAWLATYLRARKFASVDLKIRGGHLLRVDLDGKTVPTDPDDLSAHLDLEPGVHLLLIKTLQDPAAKEAWSVGARLESTGIDLTQAISVSTSPDHPLALAQILDAPRPSDATLSPDGSLAAIRIGRILPGTDDSESWVEIRRTGNGSLLRSFRGLDMRSIDWAPAGRRLSYVTRGSGDQKDRSTLWLTDLDNGATQEILGPVEHLGRYLWGPDGRSVIYEISEEPPENEIGIQRLVGLQDRQHDWRTRSYLYQVMVEGGARRRLTAGRLTTTPGSISPDSRRLLFFRSPDDYRKRPFVGNEIHLLDLGSLETEILNEDGWVNDAVWSPDGTGILVLAGPDAFDGAGRTTPGDVLANDYDGQLFLMNLDGRDVVPLSRDFDPSVSAMIWHRGDGMIYLQVLEGSRSNLYRLDPKRLRYTRIETGVEVARSIRVARESPAAIYSGSGATRPPAIWFRNLRSGKPRLLTDPGAGAFRHVGLGKVEPFDFVNSRGVRIEGRVYYPPDFDPGRRYPAIIYYYGGTLPVSRDFGGRYPKNWWAGHGYVVYVPQPSGTIGYGQEFAALHVNAWGKYAADDILEGVDAFLEAHPFVDPDRLGCIGASYGGFMTQYLVTRTDRFAAAVSHAGISDLTSYWGEGYWGYNYSAVASAESYPWNRRDLYVEQSPLFHADRIHTPLLLLHGTADVNVPPGESEQMYTALKLLDRPVEYIRVRGQDHHILKHDQRVVWSQSILAWFDRWLKEEPEWWNHLYPGEGNQE